MNAIIPPKKYLRERHVCIRYDFGKSTLYRWIAEGRFPAGTKFGPRMRRWDLTELEAWEAQQNGGAE